MTWYKAWQINFWENKNLLRTTLMSVLKLCFCLFVSVNFNCLFLSQLCRLVTWQWLSIARGKCFLDEDIFSDDFSPFPFWKNNLFISFSPLLKGLFSKRFLTNWKLLEEWVGFLGILLLWIWCKLLSKSFITAKIAVKCSHLRGEKLKKKPVARKAERLIIRHYYSLSIFK